MQLRFLKSKDINVCADEDLLHLYTTKGDNYYYAKLFQRYTHLIFGVCMKYLSHEENSKDAVMEIFEQTLEKAKNHPIKYYKGWIYAVTKNHCLLILRKEKNLNGKKAEFEKNFKINMEFEQELHPIYENDEMNNLNLHQNLTRLNHEQRRCIELFYLDGKSYKEVAQLTGFDLNDVKSHLQNGKRNLKNILTNKIK